MADLILLRHGQSQWNLENRFTGWVDIDLSEQGRAEAHRAGELLRGRTIDKVYSSELQRAVHTAEIALKEAGLDHLEIIRDSALNERHYGDLQGLNKAETAEKYGDEQVHIWRRSFDTPPPGDDAESLKTTMDRVMPYFHERILPDLAAGKNVLVAAHGNSLRALMYELDSHTPESITQLNIPTGVPIVYEVDVVDGKIMVKEKEQLA